MIDTWSFSKDCLESIEYEFDTNEIIRFKNRDTLDSKFYDWMDYKTKEIVINKAKTSETKEDVVAIYIYYMRKNPYGRAGSYETSKSYHLYNNQWYSKQGLVKDVPKEVKMALKESKIELL